MSKYSKTSKESRAEADKEQRILKIEPSKGSSGGSEPLIMTEKKLDPDKTQKQRHAG